MLQRACALILFCISLASLGAAQVAATSQTPAAPDERLSHDLLEAQRAADDLLWQLRMSDIAFVDRVKLASSRPIRMANPTGQGAGNPLIIYATTFIPRKLAPGKKAPLIVFVHGGVHANLDTSYVHIMRELVEQGYVVVAPEYRGSTGYGEEFYDQIDYGGAEIDDTHSARDWAVEMLPQVDPARVGIMGWSHGGYHALLNIARWPKAYQVAYAGNPVSDLVMRMGYKGPGYQREFARFIGKAAVDDPMEYRRRSPVFYADKIHTPLLLHSNTNDEDVNVMEVEHMVAALKAAGNKEFEYRIYENAPGAHHFNRIDTALARQSRQEIYVFLARYLKP